MASGTITPMPSRIEMVSKSYTMGTQSAGAKGYFTVVFGSDAAEITSSNQIVSIRIHIGQISASGGLQLTPVNYTESTRTLYVNYYSPSAITSSFAINFYIYYLEVAP